MLWQSKIELNENANKYTLLRRQIVLQGKKTNQKKTKRTTNTKHTQAHTHTNLHLEIHPWPTDPKTATGFFSLCTATDNF